MILAQQWAEKCVYERAQFLPDAYQEKWNYSKSDYFQLGQNMYSKGYDYEDTNYDSSARMSMETWYNEKNNYNYTSKICATGETCSSYTQVCKNKPHY